MSTEVPIYVTMRSLACSLFTSFLPDSPTLVIALFHLENSNSYTGILPSHLAGLQPKTQRECNWFRRGPAVASTCWKFLTGTPSPTAQRTHYFLPVTPMSSANSNLPCQHCFLLKLPLSSPVPIWDARMAEGGLPSCATVPVPSHHFHFTRIYFPKVRESKNMYIRVTRARCHGLATEVIALNVP